MKNITRAELLFLQFSTKFFKAAKEKAFKIVENLSEPIKKEEHNSSSLNEKEKNKEYLMFQSFQKIFNPVCAFDPYAPHGATGIHEEVLDTQIPNLSIIRRAYSKREGPEEVVEIEEYTKKITNNENTKVYKAVCPLDPYASHKAIAFHEEELDNSSSPHKKKFKRTYTLTDGKKEEVHIEEFSGNLKNK